MKIMPLVVVAVIACFTSLTAAETPQKFEKLLGKWVYNDNPKFISTFEVVAIDPSGAGTIKAYKVAGRDVPIATFTVNENAKELGVKIQLGEGYWDLTYYDASGGMLSGTFNPAGRRADNGKFYRDK